MDYSIPTLVGQRFLFDEPDDNDEGALGAGSVKYFAIPLTSLELGFALFTFELPVVFVFCFFLGEVTSTSSSELVAPRRCG